MTGGFPGNTAPPHATPHAANSAIARRPRLAVFISGGGRSLLNLHDAIELGDLRATIALVVASRPCGGVEKARARGLEVVIEPPSTDPARLDELLLRHRIDWLVLAGYLHLLAIPSRFAGKAVNIHPALLPDFGGKGMYGLRVHEAVLRSGATRSGCTVHLCDAQYDRGPIVLQLTCPVLPGDTPHTLADRVFVQERRAYPLALQKLLAQESPPRERVP